MDISTITWDQVPDESKAVILKALDDALGFTVARASEFIYESRQEHPVRDSSWTRDDAIGKFKHFLRTDHGWGGAVDAAWGSLEPLAAAVVDVTISLQASG